MCICKYVYVTHIYVYIYIYIARSYISLSLYLSLCVYTCIYIYIYTYIKPVYSCHPRPELRASPQVLMTMSYGKTIRPALAEKSNNQRDIRLHSGWCAFAAHPSFAKTEVLRYWMPLSNQLTHSTSLRPPAPFYHSAHAFPSVTCARWRAGAANHCSSWYFKLRRPSRFAPMKRPSQSGGGDSAPAPRRARRFLDSSTGTPRRGAYNMIYSGYNTTSYNII